MNKPPGYWDGGSEHKHQDDNYILEIPPWNFDVATFFDKLGTTDPRSVNVGAPVLSWPDSL